MKRIFYKLAREDGWDFYTGNTINYRENIGKVVKCPNPDPKMGVCSAGVIHASKSPNECFVGASIPCSAYKVKGKPTCGDETKYGFIELEVLEEIEDLDTLFGWKYCEAKNPLNPFTLGKKSPIKSDFEELKRWHSVRDSVGYSIGNSVRASVGASVGYSVGASVWDPMGYTMRDFVRASVGASVWDSVWDSMSDSVWAYVGSLFPNIKQWVNVKHRKGEYPFQSVVNLWKRGFVASYDGEKWRLHSGEKAEIVWEGTIKDLVWILHTNPIFFGKV